MDGDRARIQFIRILDRIAEARKVTWKILGDYAKQVALGGNPGSVSRLEFLLTSNKPYDLVIDLYVMGFVKKLEKELEGVLEELYDENNEEYLVEAYEKIDSCFRKKFNENNYLSFSTNGYDVSILYSNKNYVESNKSYYVEKKFFLKKINPSNKHFHTIQREVFILKLLDKYSKYFPKYIHHTEDYIITSYIGEVLNKNNEYKSIIEKAEQTVSILKAEVITNHEEKERYIQKLNKTKEYEVGETLICKDYCKLKATPFTLIMNIVFKKL